ncbi:hypothetical protein BT96DRAFT_1024724 [Gymnopus androsaceus JB14]|uniref:EF-hand domain-containing protein n=1 Tax=Gymnopus androsaceus JB14 TaxID=1447944 RepID=A0A6A4GW65_9AGAR|nr:hypothetical protein BT96DRAFT_1024724 [Gymnopus androsaceus JB14]
MTTFAPPSVYSSSSRKPKAAASMDSFVDFDLGEKSPPHHRKSPLAFFRHRKKSTPGESRDKQPHQLSNIRSFDSFDQNSFKASQSRALPPLPPIMLSNSSMNGPQGIYASLRTSPEASESFLPRNNSSASQPSANYVYDGLPNPYEQTSPLHANYASPSTAAYSTGPMSGSIQSPPFPLQPESAMDAVIRRDGQEIVDDSQMLDRGVATGLLAESLDQRKPEHKNSIEVIEKIAMRGSANLKAASDALSTFTASPVWTDGVQVAQVLIEPAKDMVQLFDALTPYVPMLVVAQGIFTMVIQKELDRHANDKNMGVVCLTMTKFWYTLCNLKVIFEVQSNIHKDLQDLVNTVVNKMHDFGNFQNLYHKHGNIARTIRSGIYKTKITAYINAFKDFQDQLGRLLTEESTLAINDVNKDVGQLNQKVDMLIAMVNAQSPAEKNMQDKVDGYGGEEKAFQNPHFLNEIASEFGATVTPQLKSILREDLNAQLKSNEAMFKLHLEETKRDLEQTLERGTDTIISKMESGPHELIHDEDVRQIWKDKKWRLSCKTRHFIDTLHHHYSQKFSQHKKTTGETHPDQWALKFTGRAIFQPTIGDAIDSDGSGYVSIDEINRFTARIPRNWTLPIFLAHAAAGWYQNALLYAAYCINSLGKIERYAKKMLPQNRKALRSYFERGCLPEIWYIIDSLNTDTFRYQQEDLRVQFQKLTLYRQENMQDTQDHLQKNLDSVRHRMQGPEDVRAIIGTSRVEAMVLPLLMLLLERHARIIETADSLLLAEREFQDMITSMQSVAYAFGKRHSVLVEGWRQQRFDIPLQISSFSYGIFINWHTHFSSTPYDQEYPDHHMQEHIMISEGWNFVSSQHTTHGPGPIKDLLTYELPTQPSAEELRRLRLSVRTRNTKKEDAKAKERYGNLSQRVKSKRMSRLLMNRTGSIRKDPTIWVDDDDDDGSTKHKRPNSSYQFEFDDTDGVLRAISSDGYASADSSELPDIPHTKGKIFTLDDRIRSVEEQIDGMKGMLAQLLAMSTSNSQDQQAKSM